MSDQERSMTNSVYVEGMTRYVETRKAGDHFVTTFSLDNVDKRGFHNYMPVEIWNASEEVIDLLNSDAAVLVNGSIKLNKWTSKEGEERKKLLINAFEISDAEESRQKRKASFSGGTARKKSSQTTERVSEPESSDISGDNPFANL